MGTELINVSAEVENGALRKSSECVLYALEETVLNAGALLTVATEVPDAVHRELTVSVKCSVLDHLEKHRQNLLQKCCRGFLRNLQNKKLARAVAREEVPFDVFRASIGESEAQVLAHRFRSPVGTTLGKIVYTHPEILVSLIRDGTGRVHAHEEIEYPPVR